MTDEDILKLAIECKAYCPDGKEFRFYHGSELICFARKLLENNQAVSKPKVETIYVNGEEGII
jgi:hypothetical protein